MLIKLEEIYDASGKTIVTHYLDTSDTSLLIHPTQPSTLLKPSEFIAVLSADSKLREATGWNKQTQLKGESKSMTLWDRLIAHTNSVNGAPELKALNLSTGVRTNESVSIASDT